MLSYNVHGLRSKCLYPDFFEYVRSFDIFALIETHVVESETEGWKKYFNDFNLYWLNAERNHTYGRASGGILCGVNRSLQKIGINHEYQRKDNINIIKIKSPETSFVFVPVYIRGEKWSSEFEVVKEVFKNLSESNIILAGDMNVRIGNLQQNHENCLLKEFTAGKEIRQSKDFVVNSKGKKFVEFCEDNGLLVLNGRTIGDVEGHYTFVSNIGNSVNDIVAMTYEGLRMIERFEVEEKIWSDHLPLKLEIKCPHTTSDIIPLNLLPKLQWGKQNERYERKLNRNLCIAKNNGEINSLKDLTDIIHKSAIKSNIFNKPKKYKSNWFNSKCEKARIDAFKHLNIYRKASTQSNKRSYLEVVSIYKKTCKERKKEYARELERQLLNTVDAKQWWKIAKQIRGQSTEIGANISAQEFKTYFDMLLNQQQFANDIQYAPMYRTDHELDKNIEVFEITEVLKKTKENKAPGIDRVPYEFLKNASQEFLAELANQYNEMFNTSRVDSTMEESVIFPIHKKGDLNITSNYRGITFMNSSAKVLMGILNNRIKQWTESNNILNEFQAGFRSGYSTVDNIYNLASIVHLKLDEKKKVYAFFVDFSAAFDMISRNLMFFKLHSMGISTKVVNLIEKIYRNTRSVVWTGKDVSEHFYTYTGVRQGCLLSPLLFTLYLNDLHDGLEGGVLIDELNIRVLLYADDIVILAEDREVLQKMIKNLENYCIQWNMVVNLAKSKIMVFRNGGRLSTNEKWIYHNQEIEIVNEYIYLGVTLTPKMTFTKHVEARNIKSKTCINATWKELINKPQISLIAKWKIFQSVCRTTQSYAAQVWGFGWFDEVDKLQRYFLKRVLRQPDSLPNYILSLETDVQDNHFYTLKLHLDYVGTTLFKYETRRLPHILSSKIWEKRIFWAKTIETLAYQVNISTSNIDINTQEWIREMDDMSNKLKIQNYRQKRRSANASETRFYRFLNPEVGIEYMANSRNLDQISILMRTRADVLPLNGNYHGNEETKLCTLCNTREVENMQHFIAKCPILCEIRVRFLGSTYLEERELINILNGYMEDGWEKLYNYVRMALRYRKNIIQEQF